MEGDANDDDEIVGGRGRGRGRKGIIVHCCTRIVLTATAKYKSGATSKYQTAE